ncbi:MAG: hypothetical protein WC551_14295 [Patescibacteria group bacterium]|jgi:hypothetical protein
MKRFVRPSGPVKWTHCKYCGARLRRDYVGQYCPTVNCQWHHGLTEKDDTPTVSRPNNRLQRPGAAGGNDGH